MSTPVTQALSCITQAELFYFTLINCNINFKRTDLLDGKGEEDGTSASDELETLYYICLGKHSIFILDRWMVANTKFGGTMERIPYSSIEKVSSVKSINSHLDFFVILTGRDRSRGVPERLLCHSPETNRFLIKLRTCYKADYMFQNWRVSQLPEEFVDEELMKRSIDTQSQNLSSLKDLASEALSVDYIGSIISRSANDKRAWVTALTRSQLGIDEILLGNKMPSKDMLKLLPEFWQGGMSDVTFDFTDEPRGLTKFVQDKYAFFCRQNFKQDPRMPNRYYDSQGSLQYMRKGYFYVHVKEPKQLNAPNMSLGQIVDSVIETQILNHVKSYQRVGAPKEYYKKMNLTGDSASWEAWEVQLRAGSPCNLKSNADDLVSNREIGIIAVRRKYIPPVMDTSQVIVLIFYGQKEKWDLHRVFMDNVERIVDSLTATTICNLPDRLVIQTKADALLLDEDGYSWFHKRLNIQPESIYKAKQFCLVILQLLGSTGLADSLEYAMQELRENVEVPPTLEDPFVIAVRLEKASNGLPSDAPPLRFLEWKCRVWRFLAYCVDGGLAPKSLNIKTLVYNHGALVGYKRQQNLLGMLIETLLYLRAPGSEHQNGISLKAKLENPRLMANFTFNERVMIQLLEQGYIRKQLSVTDDHSQYPRFLIRLMRRSPHPLEIRHVQVRYTVCKELVRMSMDQANKSSQKSLALRQHLRNSENAGDVAVNMLVPMISRLLYENDENLQVLAVCALVNYTHNNTPMKNMVMACGAVKKVSTFLNSHNEDLVRHSCALIRNCTKTVQYRQTIASYGVIHKLFDLLKESDLPPAFRPLPILVQAIAIIGQLAHDLDIKEKITNMFSKRESSLGSGIGQPELIVILRKFLQPSQTLGGIKFTSEARQEALYFHVSFMRLLPFFLLNSLWS